MNFRIIFKKKSVFPKSEYVIEPAFIHNGVQYYSYKDIFTVPCYRAMFAIQAFEEVSLRMTREFMIEDLKANKAVFERMKEYMSKGNLIAAYEQLKIADQLLEQKKERLEWIFEPEVLYNLASIVYFDKSENPEKYDQKYSKVKIERWKKDGDSLGFFLHQPIRKYIPFSTLSKEDLEAYLKTVNDLTDHQWENIFTILSKPTLNQDLKQ